MTTDGTKSTTTNWVITSPVPEHGELRSVKAWMLENVWVGYCERCKRHHMFDENEYESLPFMTSSGDEMYAGKWCCDRAITIMLNTQIRPYYSKKPWNPRAEAELRGSTGYSTQ